MLSIAIQKLKLLGSVGVMYALTLLFLWQGVLAIIPTTSSTVSAQYVFTQKQTPKPSGIKMQSGNAQRIFIPTLNINKEIIPGIYDINSNTWNVSDIGVHFAELSNPPNDYMGNTLIYGHNNKYTFGHLAYLETGDIAEVFTDTGLKFTYSYTSVFDFEPNDTSIFNYQGKPKLSLQTCTGWMNQIRSIYQFDFVKVERISDASS